MSSNIGDQAGPLRLGIVGCGVIGRFHSKFAANLDDVTITALVDPMQERAQAIIDDVPLDGAQHFGSLADALAADVVDVVAICTPSGTHVDLASDAVAASKHVIIEKPLDVSLAKARAFEELAAQHLEVTIAVISQHRHDYSSLAVDRALKAGRLGRVTSAVANVDWYRTQAYYDSGQWRGTWEMDGGGALMNQGVHTLDLLLWFLGEPVGVFAQTARLGHEGIEVEDVLVATVTFASGALATVHASTTVYPDLGVRLQVHGTDGSAVIEGDKLTFFHARDAEEGSWVADQSTQEVPTLSERGEKRGTLDPAGSHVSQYGDAHLTQYVDIIEAIREGREPWVSLADGLMALTTARALYLSATLGQPIQIADVRSGKYDDVATKTSSFATP